VATDHKCTRRRGASNSYNDVSFRGIVGLDIPRPLCRNVHNRQAVMIAPGGTCVGEVVEPDADQDDDARDGSAGAADGDSAAG
jgi:hypothetical protein